MSDIGKWLILAGGVLVVVGGVVWGLSRLGIPFGQMPGDIQVSGDKYSFYFPIVTSIVLSILLTIVINVILMVWRR